MLALSAIVSLVLLSVLVGTLVFRVRGRGSMAVAAVLGGLFVAGSCLTALALVPCAAQQLGWLRGAVDFCAPFVPR
jgi:hypothetical protein